MNDKPTHKTVLIDEVLEYLDPKPGATYVDCTFGCGGHTSAILDHQKDCNVFAIDWDKSIIEKCFPPLKEKYGDRLNIAWANFADIYRTLKKHKVSSVDGILVDFGTSQYQIHERAGFSFRKETPLDMRMSGSHNYFTAALVLEKYPEKKLVKIFSELGEERKARKIARMIVERRESQKIQTTSQLAKIVEAAYAGEPKGKTHPATKVFQALRMYVNKELDNIKNFFPGAIHHLKPGGLLLCISFHSLEDRMVKEYFKNNTDKLEIITKKPVVASPEEVEKNPSSRSAKLRVARKI